MGAASETLILLRQRPQARSSLGLVPQCLLSAGQRLKVKQSSAQFSPRLGRPETEQTGTWAAAWLDPIQGWPPGAFLQALQATRHYQPPSLLPEVADLWAVPRD